MTIEYTVTAEFDSLPLAQEWVEWLKGGHLQQVIDGGASSATLVRFDGGPGLRLAARYVFKDMPTFTAYENGAAIALRAEGAAKFPASRGVKMTRSLAEVLQSI